jgi:hypothetical protein
MGLTIYIINNDHKISCTYNEWNSFRKSIMKSLIIYLEEKIILKKYKSIHTRNDINDFISNYYKTLYDDNINFDNFNKIFDKNYINLFIIYNLYGFYIFINKEDNYSFFSVGNSYDMLTFFTIIESYIEDNYKVMFDNFLLLLRNSINQNQIINIK